MILPTNDEYRKMSNAYYAVTYVATTITRTVFLTRQAAEEFVAAGLWWAKDHGAVIAEHECPEDSELTSVDHDEVVVTVYNNDNDKSDVYTIVMDDGYMTSDCHVQTLDEDLNMINQFELPTPLWIFDIYESEVLKKMAGKI